MNREDEAERRRCVTDAMHLIPLDVDYHDGFVVLTILYDIGWLRSYFRQREVREREDPGHKLHDGLLQCEYHAFQFKTNIRTDSFGRITYINVPFVDDDVYYDLPPSVSHLRKLKNIQISGCRQIPVELGDLPCLTEIKFHGCDLHSFDNIPIGLHLPHATCVCLESSEIPNSLIPFLNLLPNCLKELSFGECLDADEDEDEINIIISALQNDELKFHQSLTTLCIEASGVNDNGFEKLLLNVLPRFPNLQNLILHRCGINSLRGAATKIKELGLVFDTKLTKLDLRWNGIFYKGLIRSSESKSITTKLKEIDSRTSSDEKSAALLLLNTFDTISNLGGTVFEDQYDPDIEGALRNNLMKRPFTDGGITGSWPSNAALWPCMLEKVYNNSWKVYDDRYLYARQETKNKKKCATELFHMVRYGPIFAVDQCTQHEITTAATALATKKQRTKK